MGSKQKDKIEHKITKKPREGQNWKKKTKAEMSKKAAAAKTAVGELRKDQKGQNEPRNHSKTGTINCSSGFAALSSLD